MESLKMQTRKRVLQEWKKSFKVRLVFGHSKIPMEVRKTFKKDLHLPTMFTLQTILCHSGQRKNSTFPSKIEFLFFPHAEFVLFCFQNRLSSKREVLKNRYCWNKKETAQNCSPNVKNWGKKRNMSLVFNPQMKSWLMMNKKVLSKQWCRTDPWHGRKIFSTRGFGGW